MCYAVPGLHRWMSWCLPGLEKVNIRPVSHIHLGLICSHSISMLRSPKYANMGHWPNICITNPNIYFKKEKYL